MAIYKNDWKHTGVPEQDVIGGVATLYADTKAEIVAEHEEVPTVNAGTILCLPGSSCITKLGEVLIMDSTGVWAQI